MPRKVRRATHTESKLDSKSDLSILNELAELNNCNVRAPSNPELYVL